MILADSSVWIDYFNGNRSPETDRLDVLLDTRKVLLGDLVLTEVLQGFRRDSEFRKARSELSQLAVVNLGGSRIAYKSAENYRRLRTLGVTVRKTIDCIIATWCIEAGASLLYTDRDFDPFVEYLKLSAASRLSVS